MNKESTRVDDILNWFRNHKVGSVVIVIFIFIVSVGSLLNAFDSIQNYIPFRALIWPVDCSLSVTSFEFAGGTAYFAEADEIELGEEFEAVRKHLKNCKLIYNVLPAHPQNKQISQIVVSPTDGLIDQFTYHFLNDILTTITFTFAEESGFEKLKLAAHDAFGPPDSTHRQFNLDCEIWDNVGGRKFSITQTGGSLFYN